MKNIKEEIEFFVKKIEYIIPLIITAILSFGFVITHYSVNIDTLSAERYYREGELLAQHRYGGVLLDKIFGVMEFNPFFVDCLAVIFLILASIIFCLLFKKISNNKINIITYTVFSCLFVSYPLINEIFVYTPMSLGICFSFFIIAIVLNLLYEYRKDRKNIKLGITTLLMCLIMSIYESSASVYLCGIFIIEILDYIYNDNNKKILNTIKDLILMILPLILALIINVIISNMILSICNINESENAAKEIMYKELGVIGGIKNLIKTMFYSYGINGLFYLPITVMQMACIIIFVMGIVYGINKKNITIFVLFMGSICSIFSLSIIQGDAAPYRTCQVFQLFIAFAFMIMVQYVINVGRNKMIKNIFIFLSFLIVFYQAKDLNKYFYINYVRYEQEKISLISIAERLKNECDIEDKSVIFIVNEYKPSKYIVENIFTETSTLRAKIANTIIKTVDSENTTYSEEYRYIDKPMQSNINSYLTWGTYAFREVNTEIFKWLSMLGYDDFKQGTIEQVYEILKKMKEGEIIDNKSIIEEEEYIVVLIDRRFNND